MLWRPAACKTVLTSGTLASSAQTAMHSTVPAVPARKKDTVPRQSAYWP